MSIEEARGTKRPFEESAIQAEVVATANDQDLVAEALYQANIYLDGYQRAALADVVAGRTVFMTGGAGSGKSFLIKKIVAVAEAKYAAPRQVAVTASTGAAATALQGMTIHAWAGLGLGEAKTIDLCYKALGNAKVRERIRACRVLIIDEISMIAGVLFDKLEAVCSYVRSHRSRASDDNAPLEQPSVWFGGIQVVLSGDFLQLPPVCKGPETKTFAFASSAWKRGVFCTHVLGASHRQSDGDFLNLLNNVRHGQYGAAERAILGPCLERVLVNPVHLYARNEQVQARNDSMLAAIIDEPERTYNATDFYDNALNEDDRKQYRNGWPVGPRVLLKKGALVMLLYNFCVEGGLCNGSQGVIIDFVTRSGRVWPKVRFRNGTNLVVENHTWDVKEDDVVLASRTQMPLALAYALSIHKSQGMTLDAVYCDIKSAFAPGQAYVGLSRTRSIDGLSLTSLPHSVMTDSKALEFHRSIGDTPRPKQK